MTSAKQFDLPAFMAFVAGKDPSEDYDFYSVRYCPIAQFTRHLGLIGEDSSFGPIDDALVLHETCFEKLRAYPWTFGSLLSRLNNLPADPPTAAKEGGDDSPVSALTPLDGERA